MNISSNVLPDQLGSSGLVFSIDGDGRFLMTDGMAGCLPFAGVFGNQLMRLHDLLSGEGGRILDTLLNETTRGLEDGLTRRVTVHDREGRLLSVAVSRLPGLAQGRLICALDECRFPIHNQVRTTDAGRIGLRDVASRADAVRLAAALAVDGTVIGENFKIMLIGLNKPRNIEGPVAESIWSRLVKRAGNRIQAVVGARGLVARFSEDVFAVVNAQDRGPMLPEMAAGSIISSFDHPFDIDGVDFYLGINVGIADAGTGPTDISHCFRSAELALGDARRSGLSVCECTAEMVADVSEKLRFEQELREAFNYGGFELELQPKVDMSKRGFSGFEALIRWHHPERGIIQPQDFIPVAEETGLIIPITDWVLHEVCRLLRQERDAGRTPLPISINIPPSQFMRREVKDFMKVINAYEIPPSLIELELTETMTTSEVSRGIAMMSALRAAGVKISVEDFGSGSNVLSHLIKWPVSILKIDRAIVGRLPDDQEACETVMAITRVAHALDLTVVAEGVENNIQKKFLASQGVEVVQGFLFSKPLPPEQAFRLAENATE